MNLRQKVIRELACLIVHVERDHPVGVALEGVDAAGKTVLADEIAVEIEASGKIVIRASLDGFHNPQETRYRQGAESPQGYYLDSFDYDSLLNQLLILLGPGGSRKVILSVYDYRQDAPVLPRPKLISNNAILLLDGTFLLRPELDAQWDFSIFVDVSFENSISRGVERDFKSGAGLAKEEIKRKYYQRNVPGQRLYFEDAGPLHRADLIFDNNEISTYLTVLQKFFLGLGFTRIARRAKRHGFFLYRVFPKNPCTNWKLSGN